MENDYVQLLQQTIEQQKEMLAQQNAALARQQEQTDRLQAMLMEHPKAQKETPTRTPKAKEPDVFSSGPDKTDENFDAFEGFIDAFAKTDFREKNSCAKAEGISISVYSAVCVACDSPGWERQGHVRPILCRLEGSRQGRDLPYGQTRDASGYAGHGVEN
ncbi:hypothetical protein V1504DRAFT_442988 [Lipomyces starkeyi]